MRLQTYLWVGPRFWPIPLQFELHFLEEPFVFFLNKATMVVVHVNKAASTMLSSLFWRNEEEILTWEYFVNNFRVCCPVPLQETCLHWASWQCTIVWSDDEMSGVYLK